MNKTRIQQLIDCLEQLPDDQFDYSKCFLIPGMDEIDTNHLILQKAYNYTLNKEFPPCNTAGCVAGHTCLLFWENYVTIISDCGGLGFEDVARNILEIDLFVADVLFRSQMYVATKEDAINRLKHLLENDNFDGYDWKKESWKPATELAS